jgi:hypothetical protein
MKAWREANREKHLTHSRNWHEANRETHLAKMRDWRRKNRENIRAYKNAYRRKKLIEHNREQEKNPYSSATNPREYSAWYHAHHPGYFASKSKEWIERQPKSRRLVLFAKRNKKMQTYVTAYSKLHRRLRGLARGPPSFTSKEKAEIDGSAYLTELLAKVKQRYRDWAR